MPINHSLLDYSSAQHIPKKVQGFKSRHLCRWPQGSPRSQVEPSSWVPFSLSASQAISAASRVSLGYCLAYKMQICLDDRQGPRFHPARPVSLFWRYWGLISVQLLGHHLPQPDKDPQESPDFPSQACRDPTQQLRAASDCSKLSSTSSQGLLQQLGLARVHRLFKPPSWPASATSQGCSPWKARQEGAAGTRLLKLRGIEEFSHARQWMQARDLAQHCFFQIGILPTHTHCSR